MSTYKNERRDNSSELSRIQEAVVYEYISYIAEKKDYPEVNLFVDSICEAINFKCDLYDELDNGYIFGPVLVEEKLSELGIKLVECDKKDLIVNKDGIFTRKYVYFCLSLSNGILGGDIRLYVEFKYGLIKVLDYNISDEKNINSVKFPILYPYEYSISVESDYRKYYPSKNEPKNINISSKLVDFMKTLKFDVVVKSPCKVRCSYKKDNTHSRDMELIKLEIGFSKEKYACISSKKTFCLPKKVVNTILYSGIKVGRFEETAIQCEHSKYEITDNIVANTIFYISPSSKKSLYFNNLCDKSTIEYDIDYKDFFKLPEEVLPKYTEDISENILDILSVNIVLDKKYVSKKLELFEYNECLDLKSLLKSGIKCQATKSFKYPTFAVDNKEIKVNGSDGNRIVECYEINYQKRYFYTFLVKKLKRIFVYKNPLSLSGHDINIAYAEIESAVIFEVESETSERFLRKHFVEVNFDKWQEKLINSVKEDISKNKRLESEIGKLDINSIVLSKVDF